MGVIGGKAVVLGAWGELDVLAEEVLHAAELAGGVVARGGGVAVEVGADPAVGLDGADEFRLDGGGFAPFRVDFLEHSIIFGAVTDDHIIGAGFEGLDDVAIVAVVDVLDAELAGIGSEVGTGGAVLADELDFAGDRIALGVGDRGFDGGGLRKLDGEGFGRPVRRSLEPWPRAETVSEFAPSTGNTRILPCRVGAAPGVRLVPLREDDVGVGDGLTGGVLDGEGGRASRACGRRRGRRRDSRRG